MTPDLIIELPASPKDPLKITRIRNGAEEDVSALGVTAAGPGKVVALAPVLAVAHFRRAIHSRSDADARREALFAIEDDLAQPVEEVHVALGPKAAAGGLRDIYVVDEALLKAWQSALARLGAGRAPIIAEASLPWTENSACRIGNRVILAGPAGVTGACADLPEHAIDAIRDAALGVPTPIVQGSLAGTLLPLLKQGRFVRLAEPANAGASRTGAGAWAYAGALAAACLLVWTGSIWLETARKKSAAADLEQQAASLFSARFPGTPLPGNIHAEARRLTAEGAPSAETGFRTLAGAVYEALGALPSLSLAQMSYTHDAGVLTVSLRPADPATETAFADRLRAAGWTVEAGGRSEGGASFVLRAAP